MTALWRAAERGHDVLVGALLNRGADPTIADHAGRTPRQMAQVNGHDECVKLLQVGTVGRPGTPIAPSPRRRRSDVPLCRDLGQEAEQSHRLSNGAPGRQQDVGLGPKPVDDGETKTQDGKKKPGLLGASLKEMPLLVRYGLSRPFFRELLELMSPGKTEVRSSCCQGVVYAAPVG
jgi:hypothetical protein